MANIIIPGTWTDQPQYPTQLDRSNPLTRGLKVAYNPAAGNDSARDISLSVRPTLGVSRYGKAVIGDGTNYAQFPTRVAPTSASFTLFSISRFTNGNCVLAIENEYTNQWRIQPYPSGSNLVVNGMGDYSLGAKSGYTDYTKLTICCDSGVTNGTRSYREGVLVITNTVTMGTLSGNYPVTVGSKRYIPTTNGAGDDNALVLFWDRPLSEAEVFAINANPWQVFRKAPKILYFSVASGAVTHPSTGALTADSAVISGTAAHIALHPSTGALAADSAVVAGTAARIANHQSTGALSAGDAVVDGTAVNTPVGTVSHPSTGALTADSAIVAGTATHIVNHQTTGALLADSAVVDGASVHIGTGAPTNLTGTPTNSTINWTWDSVATATGYEIEFGLDGGGYTVVDVGNTLTYEQTGLNENTLYEARVRAYYDVTGYLLLESNDRLLLESGDGLLQEAA